MKFRLIYVITLILFIAAPVSAKVQNLELLPLFNSQTKQENRIWVGTFQLAWNDLMDGIVKGPIRFWSGTPSVVKELNKQTFKDEQLSEDSYFKAYGATSPNLKEEIEAGIKEKFDETSDVLDGLDWSKGRGKYTVYAMLKKNFKFIAPFDILEPAKFGKSADNVDYFGISKTSKKVLNDMVHVLFYNSKDDFAVVIMTDGQDLLYLYRTNDNKTFNKLYSDMLNKQQNYEGSTEFASADELKVPDIKFFKKQNFDDVCNKRIIGTDFGIDKALETVDFKMNNEGVELKSESVITTKLMSLRPDFVQKPRYFYFNDSFVLFLKEMDKDLPYFALRVNDVNFINGFKK